MVERGEVGGEQVILKWRSHLAAERREALVWLGPLVVLGLALIYWAFTSIILLAFSAAVIAAVLSQYFLPVTYTLTDRGVTVRSPVFGQDRRWAEFTSYQVYPDGVGLAFDQRSVRGRMLREILLYYDPDRKGEVLQIVKERMDARG